MGGVRTKTVKRAARLIIERHYPRLTRDFHTNKKICDEVATIESKRLRNKIAGFITHLMGRIEKGPVRGISFKLQEEERERRDNYVPAVSAVDTKHIEVDADTQAMLKAIGFADIAGVELQSATPDVRRQRRTQGDRRQGANRARQNRAAPTASSSGSSR